ncbi:ABC transporter substrate-binding protein [Roseomonas populi]|uniref:ABC transporter substrate-binding protein n=1 Tax=Roseomonas populi TaxID=3121582 RepID=A0ABT1XC89_9PROT|nr:ABC transporter substrate-binding protein [Roseomonas pecuniae]MCR0985023.1 ABC transporter substrate-binding protein [Roseomonas pecuniae]
MKRAILALAGGLALLAPAAQARTLRYASVGDIRTMDPHGLYETFTQSTLANIYESLLRMTEMLELEPSLAVSWEQARPDMWRFRLRPGVRFQDGTPLAADDVVFSIQRAMADGSDMKVATATIRAVTSPDPMTVEIETKGPNPILPREIVFLGIMSRSWAEAHNATQPVDIRKGQDNFASRNANGTGPFRLVLREPDSRTVLASNPGWWDTPRHNLTEVVFRPIGNSATRVAALLSGELDLMEPVPVQDIPRIAAAPGLRVLQGPEIRTVFLGMDQAREQLTDSPLRGRNPLKDLRVRRAMLLAVDAEAIHQRIMRRESRVAGLIIGPGIEGYDAALDLRPRTDVEAAKRLMAEAGYADGFEIGLDCPNDRLVNDAAICTAVVPMLARIGIKVVPNIRPRAQWSQKVLSRDTSFYLQSWSTPTYDAFNPLVSIAAAPRNGHGAFNSGGYENARIEELIPRIQRETDAAGRRAMIGEVLRIHRDEIGHIPLHQQFLAWGVRANVATPLMPDNVIKLWLTRID